MKNNLFIKTGLCVFIILVIFTGLFSCSGKKGLSNPMFDNIKRIDNDEIVGSVLQKKENEPQNLGSNFEQESKSAFEAGFYFALFEKALIMTQKEHEKWSDFYFNITYEEAVLRSFKMEEITEALKASKFYQNFDSIMDRYINAFQSSAWNTDYFNASTQVFLLRRDPDFGFGYTIGKIFSDMSILKLLPNQQRDIHLISIIAQIESISLEGKTGFLYEFTIMLHEMRQKQKWDDPFAGMTMIVDLIFNVFGYNLNETAKL